MRKMAGPKQLRQSVAIGSNPERNRAHNRRVVLEVIRLHGHLGRSAIAEHARLTPQAVANIVGDLLDKGMLVQLGRLRSGRGQPPIQFALNPDGPMTAGVEIAADHLVAVLMDLAGRVRAEKVQKLASPAPEAVVRQVGETLASLCAGLGLVAEFPILSATPDWSEATLRQCRVPEAAPQPGESHQLDPLESLAPGRLMGVGVVMPGPFEVEGMSSVGPTTLPGWVGVDAKRLFTSALALPVFLGNDATAAAVGERLYGAGQQTRSFCYLYFGVGLGLGILQNGRPVTGAFGNAGEIGHINLMPRSGAGLAGAAGALERVASVHALREALAKAGKSAETVEDLARLLDEGSPELAQWTHQAADYLAPAVAMLENIFDPETVIFGGRLPDQVISGLIAALEPLPVSVASRPSRSLPRVVAGQTGQLTAALGAASLPLLDTVSPHLSEAEAAS